MAEEPTDTAGASDDELHRRFRAALEKKRQDKHESADSPRARGKSSGPSDPKVKRQFRRKSG